MGRCMWLMIILSVVHSLVCTPVCPGGNVYYDEAIGQCQPCAILCQPKRDTFLTECPVKCPGWGPDGSTAFTFCSPAWCFDDGIRACQPCAVLCEQSRSTYHTECPVKCPGWGPDAGGSSTLGDNLVQSTATSPQPYHGLPSGTRLTLIILPVLFCSILIFTVIVISLCRPKKQVQNDISTVNNNLNVTYMQIPGVRRSPTSTPSSPPSQHYSPPRSLPVQDGGRRQTTGMFGRHLCLPFRAPQPTLSDTQATPATSDNVDGLLNAYQPDHEQNW